MENTNIQEVEGIDYVMCPYCKSKMTNITWTHLKTHGKTLQEMHEEFPGIKGKCDKLIEKKRLISQQHKNNHNKLKTIRCCYCQKEMEVKNNESNTQACQECLDKGLENPDKRRSKQAQIRREQTFTEKYGVKNSHQIQSAIDKANKTNKEKYGGTGFASEVLSKKTRKSIQEIYGQDNYMKTEEGRNASSIWSKKENNPERAKKISDSLKGRTNKLKGKNYEEIYGKEKTKEILKLKKELGQAKFLNDFDAFKMANNVILMDNEYIGAFELHNWKCSTCGTIFKSKWCHIKQRPQCPKCFPKKEFVSFAEIEIVNYIKTILPESEEIITSSKAIIPPKELDIYIPSRNIAIEYDGLYWHSEQKGKDKYYHINKTLACVKKDIHLIHIFEDEWVLHKNIVKSRLSQLLKSNNVTKIHARKCTIKEISYQEKYDFLYNNHLMGPDKSKISLGAFYNDELISVMTFSHGSIAKGSKAVEGVWELNRFASKIFHSIPGIASKLLKYFQRNYDWNEIFSYADRKWSQGNVYEKMGFDFAGSTRPNYYYISNQGIGRINRWGLRKTKDDPADLTEMQARELEGYTWIWDCGTLKFTMINSNKKVIPCPRSLNIEKHILTEDEKFKSVAGDLIICPYCHKTFKDQLTTTHLKSHGKTFEDAKYEFPNINFVSNSLKLKLRLNKSKTKQAICVFCGNKTTVSVESSKNKVVCEECKSKGLKVKLTKIVTCYFCKKECKVGLRSSNKYSVCKECKSKGLKNPQASKNAKLAGK